MVLRGGCQCGGVRFEIDGPLMGVGNCHCGACRTTQGAAFRTRARVRRNDFRWVAGKELVRSHQSSPGFHRGFCGQCGSPVVNWYSAEAEYSQRNPASLETYGIAVASLEGDPGVPAGVSRVRGVQGAVVRDYGWGLPQFAGYPVEGVV